MFNSCKKILSSASTNQLIKNESQYLGSSCNEIQLAQQDYPKINLKKQKSLHHKLQIQQTSSVNNKMLITQVSYNTIKLTNLTSQKIRVEIYLEDISSKKQNCLSPSTFIQILNAQKEYSDFIYPVQIDMEKQQYYELTIKILAPIPNLVENYLIERNLIISEQIQQNKENKECLEHDIKLPISYQIYLPKFSICINQMGYTFVSLQLPNKFKASIIQIEFDRNIKSYQFQLKNNSEISCNISITTLLAENFKEQKLDFAIFPKFINNMRENGISNVELSFNKAQLKQGLNIAESQAAKFELFLLLQIESTEIIYPLKVIICL